MPLCLGPYLLITFKHKINNIKIVILIFLLNLYSWLILLQSLIK